MHLPLEPLDTTLDVWLNTKTGSGVDTEPKGDFQGGHSARVAFDGLH